jgi:hypothetical protein
MDHFLWNNTEDKHKYHLANWQLASQKKEAGGLDVPNLRSLNMALLSSWIFRYHLNSNSTWTRIVDFKYRLRHLTFFVALMWDHHPFGRGFCGLCKLPIWALDGWLVMEKRLGSGKING